MTFHSPGSLYKPHFIPFPSLLSMRQSDLSVANAQVHTARSGQTASAPHEKGDFMVPGDCASVIKLPWLNKTQCMH